MANPAECRIDLLPEFILHHILSFLPIKDAVRSSTLSKRWRYLYTAIPVVEFNEDDFLKPQYVNCGSHQAIHFFEVVDQFLSNHVCCLERFSLQVTIKNESQRKRFYRCLLHLTTEKKVEELSLGVQGYADLPLHFLHDITLLHLKLNFCYLQPVFTCSLPILKSLHLHDVVLDREILDMCPNLESLTFDFCWGVGDMQISANHLTNLRIVGSHFSSLKIVAPSLQSFELNCLDCFGIDRVHGDVVRVKILTACSCVFEAFYEDDKSVQHQFNELEVLIVRSCLTRRKDQYLASLLRASPNLRVLCIEGCRYPSLADSEASYEAVACLLQNLRVANFKSFKWHETELVLLNYVISCAPSLEHVRINFDPVLKPDVVRIVYDIFRIKRQNPRLKIDFPLDSKDEAVMGVYDILFPLR